MKEHSGLEQAKKSMQRHEGQHLRPRKVLPGLGLLCLLLLLCVELLPSLVPPVHAETHTAMTVNETCATASYTSDGNPFSLCPGPYPTGGNCVWWAWEQWHRLGYDLPLNWGNAADWIVDAEQAGLPLGTMPRVASIAIFPVADGVWAYGPPGHVAFVTRVSPNGSSFDVTYQNYGDPTPMYTGSNYQVPVINQPRFQHGSLRFLYFPLPLDASRFAQLPGITAQDIAALPVGVLAPASSPSDPSSATPSSLLVSSAAEPIATTNAETLPAGLVVPVSTTQQTLHGDFTGTGTNDLLLYNRQEGRLDILVLTPIAAEELPRTGKHPVYRVDEAQPDLTSHLVSLSDAATGATGWGSSLTVLIGDVTHADRDEIVLYDTQAGTIQVLMLNAHRAIEQHRIFSGWGTGWQVSLGRFDGQHESLLLYRPIRTVMPSVPTPSSDATATPTTSPSATPGAMLTPTGTSPIPLLKETPTPVRTSTPSSSPSLTLPASGTPTVPSTISPTATGTGTPSPLLSPTPTVTSVPTATPTLTPSPTSTATPTPGVTPTPDPSPTGVPTATPTPLPTSTPQPTPTPQPSPTPSPTPTSIPTATPTPTVVPTDTPTATPSLDPQPTATPLPSPTPTATQSATTQHRGQTGLFAPTLPETHRRASQSPALAQASSNVQLVTFDATGTPRMQRAYTLWNAYWEFYVGRFTSVSRDDLFIYDRTSGEGHLLLFDASLRVHHETVLHDLQGNWRVTMGDFLGAGTAQLFLYDPTQGTAQMLAFAPDGRVHAQQTYSHLGTHELVYVGHFGLPTMSVMLHDPTQGQSLFLSFGSHFAISRESRLHIWRTRWQILVGSFLPRTSTSCVDMSTCAAHDEVLVLDRQTGQLAPFVVSLNQNTSRFDPRATAFERLGVTPTLQSQPIEMSIVNLAATLQISIRNEELY